MVDDAIGRAEVWQKHRDSQGGLDGFALCADYCFNTGPFLSPRRFADLITPYLARVTKAYRDMGFYVIKHTDGNIMPIIDQLVETRPHALHSLDPQGNVDIAEVKRRYGDQLCLIGNVNCAMLDTGTEEQVDRVRPLRAAQWHAGRRLHFFHEQLHLYGHAAGTLRAHARRVATGGNLPMKTKLNGRERMNLALSHQEADRVPRTESFWPETIPLWYQQGLKVGDDVADLFDFDVMGGGWVSHEARPGYLATIEETDAWWTRLDGNGAILRYWKHKSGTPEHVGFGVDTRDKWEAHKRAMLEAPAGSRVDTFSTLRRMYEARAKGRWFCWTGVEAYETAKDVFGHEQLSIIMAEDPEWAKDIFDTEADVAIAVLDHLERSGVQFDGAWVYGDIAYNHAPFFSPRMYRQQIKPAHARQIAWFKERGLPVIYHTDGDFRLVMPDLIEIGVDCFQPLEAKAHMDVRELKPQYGDRVTLMGNIDIMVLITNNWERIEAEVAAKIPMAKAGGGYIYHSDHSIAPGVTWATYRFLMELVEKYGRY